MSAEQVTYSNGVRSRAFRTDSQNWATARTRPDVVLVHDRRLVSHLSGRLRGDSYEAEDLAQEVWMRFFRSLDRLDAEAGVWPWLRTIADRVAIDHYRRCSGKRRPEIVPSPPEAFDILGDACDEYEAVDTRESIRQALQALPQRQRQAIEAVDIAGATSREAAVAFRMDGNAFRQLLFRARRNLRGQLVECRV